MWMFIACAEPDTSPERDGAEPFASDTVAEGEDPEAPPVDCTTLPPEVLDIATAPDDYRGLVEPVGEDIVGWFGGQGAWHVVVGATVRLPAESVGFDVEVFDQVTSEYLTTSPDPIFLAAVDWSPETCLAVVHGQQIVLAPADEPQGTVGCEHADHDVEISIALVDLQTGAVTPPVFASTRLAPDIASIERAPCAD